MNVQITDLQKRREELRARLLANTEIRDQIAFRAYELYQNRSGGNGSALEDWLRAENEIVSSLVEKELQLLSESAERQGFEGKPSRSPKPRVKREKASQSGAASISGTAKPTATARQAKPSVAKAVKKEKKSTRTVRKPSDVSTGTKEGRDPESPSV